MGAHLPYGLFKAMNIKDYGALNIVLGNIKDEKDEKPPKTAGGASDDEKEFIPFFERLPNSTLAEQAIRSGLIAELEAGFESEEESSVHSVDVQRDPYQSLAVTVKNDSDSSDENEETSSEKQREVKEATSLPLPHCMQGHDQPSAAAQTSSNPSYASILQQKKRPEPPPVSSAARSGQKLMLKTRGKADSSQTMSKKKGEQQSTRASRPPDARRESASSSYVNVRHKPANHRHLKPKSSITSGGKRQSQQPIAWNRFEALTETEAATEEVTEDCGTLSGQSADEEDSVSSAGPTPSVMQICKEEEGDDEDVSDEESAAKSIEDAIKVPSHDEAQTDDQKVTKSKKKRNRRAKKKKENQPSGNAAKAEGDQTTEPSREQNETGSKPPDFLDESLGPEVTKHCTDKDRATLTKVFAFIQKGPKWTQRDYRYMDLLHRSLSKPARSRINLTRRDENTSESRSELGAAYLPPFPHQAVDELVRNTKDEGDQWALKVFLSVTNEANGGKLDFGQDELRTKLWNRMSNDMQTRVSALIADQTSRSWSVHREDSGSSWKNK